MQQVRNQRQVIRQRVNGFTLVEIMIALVLLAFIVFPLFEALFTTRKGVERTEAEMLAITLLQKIVEDIRYDLYNLDTDDFKNYVAGLAEDKTRIVTGSECSKFFKSISDAEYEVNFRQFKKFKIYVMPKELEAPDKALIKIKLDWENNIKPVIATISLTKREYILGD